ncbi:MAG: transposase [Lentimicrobium sp.]|nr:transposase [Lentimicrobium sp.]
MKVDYNNLFIHFVFITAGRIPYIQEIHRDRIEKYITGIIKNCDSRLYAIYANPEHMHFIISKSPDYGENQLAEIIANASAKFINDNNLCKGVFAWQQSCSAFSVSKSDVDKVSKYIINQPEHHKIHTFEEEYHEFLKIYQHSLNPTTSV